jgi:predicted nucleic acid-binding Zn ribbon protein
VSELVEDHRHCIVCGKPIPTDKYVCSPSCEEILRRQQKSYQRMRLYTTVTLLILFIIVLLMVFIKGGS